MGVPPLSTTSVPPVPRNTLMGPPPPNDGNWLRLAQWAETGTVEGWNTGMVGYPTGQLREIGFVLRIWPLLVAPSPQMSDPSRFGFVLHNRPSSLRPRPGWRNWVRFARSCLVPLATAGNWLCFFTASPVPHSSQLLACTALVLPPACPQIGFVWHNLPFRGRRSPDRHKGGIGFVCTTGPCPVARLGLFFVLHNRPFVGRSSPPDLFRIGFVSHDRYRRHWNGGVSRPPGRRELGSFGAFVPHPASRSPDTPDRNHEGREEHEEEERKMSISLVSFIPSTHSGAAALRVLRALRGFTLSNHKS